MPTAQAADFTPSLPTDTCKVNAYGWLHTYTPPASAPAGETPPYNLYNGGWSYDTALGYPTRPSTDTPVTNTTLNAGQKVTELDNTSTSGTTPGTGEEWLLVSRLEGTPNTDATLDSVMLSDDGNQEHKFIALFDTSGTLLAKSPTAADSSLYALSSTDSTTFTWPANGIAYAYVWIADYKLAMGNIGVVPCRTDYSDAPLTGTSYGGAAHKVRRTIYMGSGTTADTTDRNSATAAADSYDDGVTLNGSNLQGQTLVQGGSATLQVAVTQGVAGSGYLQGWIDWNGDGDFADSGEQIATNRQYSAGTTGTINIAVSVPANTTTNSTYARFRWSSTQNLNSTTAAADGEVEDYQLTIVPVDHGDAPANMSSVDANLTNTYGDAIHTLDGVTYLGAQVDAEGSAQDSGLAADGDDTNGVNDDDGVAFPLSGSYRVLRVGQSNSIGVTASVNGYLNAWMDWNQDGDWDDPGEQIATNRSLSAGSNTLPLTIANAVPQGATYARFRFTSASVASPSPVGILPNGEVEDYRVNIVLPTPANACTTGLVNGDFEEPSAWQMITPEDQVPYWSTKPANPADGQSFAKHNSIEIWDKTFNSWDAGIVPPYQGDRFAEINAEVAGNLYQDIEVTPGTTIHWRFAHRGRQGADTLALNIGAPGAEIGQGQFTTDNTGWKVYSGAYTVPLGQTITRFSFESISTASGDPAMGNFIDAVEFPGGCDFGDAPESYATSQAYHTADSQLYLGSVWGDTETAAQSNASASGDDAAGVDDEDGVAVFPLLSQGDTGYTIPAANITATGTGKLYAWVDFNGNGSFDASEFASTTVTAGSLAGDLVFSGFGAVTASGTTYVRLRLTTDTLNATGFAQAASDGEIEDYQLPIQINRFPVSGRVYIDANVDGVNATAEAGIDQLPLVLFGTDDNSNPVCISTRTDASGHYTFPQVLPGTYQVYEAAQASVPVPQSCATSNARDPSGYVSTTASVSATFSVVDAAVDDLDFGDVKGPSFELDNEKTGVPNSQVVHPHRFTAQADGSVSFSLAGANPDPSSLAWGNSLLLDANCDGQLDGGDSNLAASLDVSAGEQVCILVKVLTPAEASAGAILTLTVQSDFAFAGSLSLANVIQQHTDITRIVGGASPTSGGGQLALRKSVWNETRNLDGSAALPGETLRYTIEYENVGNRPLNELVIHDSVPAFTRLVAGSMECTADRPPELPTCSTHTDASGGLSWVWAAIDGLNPGSAGSVSYQVAIE
ncbi:MAG: DUF11 domain-containing protein [Thiothrix sp.]|nr:DUF11 domain-containing protein [Thiothrix sp.]